MFRPCTAITMPTMMGMIASTFSGLITIQIPTTAKMIPTIIFICAYMLLSLSKKLSARRTSPPRISTEPMAMHTICMDMPGQMASTSPSTMHNTAEITTFFFNFLKTPPIVSPSRILRDYSLFSSILFLLRQKHNIIL